MTQKDKKCTEPLKDNLWHQSRTPLTMALMAETILS